MADPISDYYADNPVEVLDQNQREWYDPDVLLLFAQNSLFQDVITYKRNLGDVRATKMHVTQIFQPHANYNALTTRQIWLPAMHIDSRSVEITFEHHGGKVAYHEYDDLVTYWKANGVEGLRRILNEALGGHIINVHNMLGRNAFIQGALSTTGFKWYGGTATDWGDLDATCRFTPDIAAEMQLGMKYRRVPGALNPNGNGMALVCYTSPGVIFDIQDDDDFIEAIKYADPSRLLRYEVGAIKSTRFVEHPDLTLWNCGTVEYQAAAVAAITAGDGAPNPESVKVDGVYRVGQEGAIKHYIQLHATPVTGTLGTELAVNDMVTIHISRTSSFGVTNGVNPFDGTLHNRRVIGVDLGNNRITLDQPIMLDFITDLGSGVYAWVTKGVNVHASIFVGGPQAIVAGLAAPIRLHTPPVIDDLMSIHRYSWNDRMGYQPYDPNVFEVVFTSGTVRVKGPKQAI